jgi:23S rRNA (adenine1618-N6)-methyltransferase
VCSAEAPGFHPRNRHQGRYDVAALVEASPELGPFVLRTPGGALSIDFADPRAVKALNLALLAAHYGVRGWDIPEGYLCPPIPGRADYVHHLADLLARGRGGAIPRGATVRILDLGVGANAIYPLLGHREYGWSFVGTDIDPGALASARRILAANPGVAAAVALRHQPRPAAILDGVVEVGERFAACVCNPPFHASAADARAGSERKWRNLGRGGGRRPVLNFGGQAAELWCPGGEAGFLGRLIAESLGHAEVCGWFTALVSRAASLPGLLAALRVAGAAHRVVEMGQGHKRSRILAWTFQR